MKKLKDPKIVQEFRLELRNRFQPLADLDEWRRSGKILEKGWMKQVKGVLGLRERKA